MPNRDDIKPGREKLFQVKVGSGNRDTKQEEEFKKDASERKYSKEPGTK